MLTAESDSHKSIDDKGGDTEEKTDEQNSEDNEDNCKHSKDEESRANKRRHFLILHIKGIVRQDCVRENW